MSAATISSKGQITNPNNIRALLDLHSGDRISFIVEESGEVCFLPATHDISTLKGIVSKPQKAVTVEEMKATIKARDTWGPMRSDYRVSRQASPWMNQDVLSNCIEPVIAW